VSRRTDRRRASARALVKQLIRDRKEIVRALVLGRAVAERVTPPRPVKRKKAED